MGLVTAKCTQCGASISVDDSKDAGICTHCGTAYVTEKVINNYNSYFTQNVTKNIYGREKTEAEEYLANGEMFIKLKDWNKAVKVLMQAAELIPGDYRCWFALVRAETENFTDLSDIEHTLHLEKALAVADEKQRQTINSACEKYLKLKVEYNKRIAEYQREIAAASKGAVGILIGAFVLITFGPMLLLMGIIMFAVGIKEVGTILIPIGVALTIPAIICIVVGKNRNRRIKSANAKVYALRNEMLNEYGLGETESGAANSLFGGRR